MIPILAKSIDNLTDARYFASWQADWIALTAEKEGKEVLDMSAIKEIISWLDGSQLMLSFDKTPLEEAAWLTRESGLQALMIPFQKMDKDPGLDIFMTLEMDDPTRAAENLHQAFRQGNFVVLSGGREIGGQLAFLREVLPTPFLRKKTFLDFPLTGDMIPLLDESLPGVGFCLSGGLEERPGYKSFEDIDELVEVLRPWD